jgi:hypothetical protein
LIEARADTHTGAFAFFGPQQFEDLYPHMIQPAAHQKLFFAGEALSACHACVRLFSSLPTH